MCPGCPNHGWCAAIIIGESEPPELCAWARVDLCKSAFVHPRANVSTIAQGTSVKMRKTSFLIDQNLSMNQLFWMRKPAEVLDSPKSQGKREKACLRMPVAHKRISQ